MSHQLFLGHLSCTVRVINHIEKENKLFVEILSYQVGETRFPANQIELTDTLMSIEKVTFKSIDTTGLLRTLNDRGPLKYVPPKPALFWRQPSNSNFAREPLKEFYSEPFSIAIKDVKFIAGGVTFEKKIPKLKRVIKFQIVNEDIIEAYDSIKNYFANVLKTKKIQVVPSITHVGGVVQIVEARSDEIEEINKALIEEVKFDLVKAIGKKESSVEQQIFTMEEYLETFGGDEIKPELIFKDENDFLKNILEKSGTKHYNQLRYLSSKHQHEILKLRFVHKPFSFVFLLKGNDKFHIVWETLDTEEATYIWTIANDIKQLKQAIKEIDQTIGLIFREGKIEYLKLKKEDFSRVFHDYTDLQNGFKNWKDEIKKVIVS